MCLDSAAPLWHGRLYVVLTSASNVLLSISCRRLVQPLSRSASASGITRRLFHVLVSTVLLERSTSSATWSVGCLVCMTCRAVFILCLNATSPHHATRPIISRFMLTNPHLYALSNHFARSPTAMESICCQGFPSHQVCDVVSQPCTMCMVRYLRTGRK